ncbi:sulfurtransferase [Pseudorhodobacter sp. MZDSW-24AT]|uniref:sulfurtransferase n=1 Tax=Pseudorhodobacter sp. MZDSW-24AT TaxID=2052957 RepID=UPI000C1E10A0|nr:rhodanese-like domain-containing protein [Pseudorhodobacter sp. MZDSW-24AT]PJF10331.1 rhodanese family protein [Pseudorhodobacter sp. MZDSW-24AT]
MEQRPLVEPSELAGLGPIRLLYVPAADEKIEGLRTVPIADWVRHALKSRSGLDDDAYWLEAFTRLGVGPDALTVVIDDGRMTEAARVWFMLQYFGLPAAVLNGGVDALDMSPQQAPDYTGQLVLVPGSGSVELRDRDTLKGELDRVQIFDARTQAEYRGEDLKGNNRGGHLPGARNLSHADLLDGTRLKPAATIARMLDETGLDGGKPIVSHCNGGGRAALAALAAMVSGRSRVSVYYLSFADWAADESCPIHLQS